MLRKLLFETTVGDWMLRAFERLTGLGLVELGELESWQYGTVEPTPARQR
jgi:hypothetical protein